MTRPAAGRERLVVLFVGWSGAVRREKRTGMVEDLVGNKTKI